MSDNAIDEESYKGYTIKIVQDTDPMDPRENDNLGTISSFHRNYELSTKDNPFKEPSELEEFLEDPANPVIALPVYLYDHSVQYIRTVPFTQGPGYFQHAEWDSGQVGYIWVTYEKVKKEYGWKRLTPARIKQVEDILRAEVEELNHYISGDVWGWVVEDEGGNVIESVWGYYDYSENEEEMLREARAVVDAELEEARQYAQST